MLSFWNPDVYPYVIAWDAWATFAIGLAAVWGAYRIGIKQAGIARRQADITEKQTKILERQTSIAASQVDLEQIKLRADLYEKRMAICEVFNATIAYIQGADGKLTNEERNEFNRAWMASRFLFGRDVDQLGKRIVQAGYNLRTHVGKLNRLKDEEREAKFDDLYAKTEQDQGDLEGIAKDFSRMMVQYMALDYKDEKTTV